MGGTYRQVQTQLLVDNMLVLSMGGTRGPEKMEPGTVQTRGAVAGRPGAGPLTIRLFPPLTAKQKLPEANLRMRGMPCALYTLTNSSLCVSRSLLPSARVRFSNWYMYDFAYSGREQLYWQCLHGFHSDP